MPELDKSALVKMYNDFKRLAEWNSDMSKHFVLEHDVKKALVHSGAAGAIEAMCAIIEHDYLKQ